MPSKSKGIEVFVRVRPSKKVDKSMTLEPEDGKIDFNFSKDAGMANDQIRTEHYGFQFNGILDMLTRQESVFDKIAKDVIEGCFDGYNGTIFAYGQTGSGKTFTMTGGAERYADRGIIPRTLSYIFAKINKDTKHQFSINVSYLEIYNNAGYDLLDENHSSKNLFDLAKVQVMETENEQFVLKNLSVHRAENEEDALNLLFIGDTNRVVSETPKNDSSTRGHCIFIIQVEAQALGSDVKTVSKLHLVDLSGSERPSTTGIDGKTLKEAININGSLLQLSMCIQALNKKAKGEPNIYIPFRNSMMTQVLRDSLGGNCNTKMIATVSPCTEDMHESLSTCRFARSVSLIQNKMTRNERVDPGVIISRLKKEVAELKAELAMAKGGEQKDHLTSEDIERCNLAVKDFIDSNDQSKTLVMPDRLMINQCFYHFKTLYTQLLKKKGGPGVAGVSAPAKIEDDRSERSTMNGPGNSMSNAQHAEEVQRLNLLVKQRDNEIGILLNYLNKKKAMEAAGGGGGSMDVSVQRIADGSTNASMNGGPPEEEKQGTLYQMMSAGKAQNPNFQKSIKERRIEFELNQTNAQNAINKTKGLDREFQEVQNLVSAPIQCTMEDLADRAKAFDMFRKSYRKNEAMEDNRSLLKEKYGRGKALGQAVNQSRQQIKQLTSDIEQIRKQNAMRGLVDDNGEIIKTPEEEEKQGKITNLKKEYQNQYNELKELKSEIERIQNLLERCREKMQKDFEQWLEVMIRQKQVEQSGGNKQIAGANTTNSSQLGATSDKRVQDNLREFYKARDAIYSETQNK